MGLTKKTSPKITKQLNVLDFFLPQKTETNLNGVMIPVLRAESQSGHQDVRDEAHGGNVEVGCVHVETWRHGRVLLVADLPVLQHHSKQAAEFHFSTCGSQVS